MRNQIHLTLTLLNHKKIFFNTFVIHVEEDTKEKGKLYKPTSRLEEKSSADQAQEYARLLGERGKPERPGKKKEREKRKSNLELFKEELRV